MPQEIALHGVIVPSLLALAAAAVMLFVPMRGRGALVLRARAALVAVAIAFALSFRARQGWNWPIASKWEWFAPAIAAISLVGILAPAGFTREARWIVGAAMALVAGAVMAWSLALPGFDSWSWRLAIGAATTVLALVLLGAMRAPIAALLGASASLGGLALVVIASAFEKLTTITACVGATLLGATVLVALANRRRSARSSPRSAPNARAQSSAARTAPDSIVRNAGMLDAPIERLPAPALASVIAALIVGATAIGASYAHDDFPRWPWLVALLAPIAMLPALAVPSRRLRGAIMILLAALVALGNAGLVLAPLIRRGDFPPA